MRRLVSPHDGAARETAPDAHQDSGASQLLGTTLPRRIACLLPLLLVAVGLAGPNVPARAQGSARFAFADTTLLRDTLDLHFDRLFETADSLRMLPDTLRAQMIRYRLSMGRLVSMADSMGVPVDSVGPVITRENFNPLNRLGTGISQTSFKYTSSYNFNKNSTTWENGADYTLTRGVLFLHNSTNISMERTNTSGRLSLRQTRFSNSEANWKVAEGLTTGGRAAISGFDSRDPNLNNEGETKTDLQFSSRMRRELLANMNTEMNLLAGYLDLKNFSLIKRGLSSDLNGRLRWLRGNWFSHDLTAGANGNLARTRKPSSSTTLNSKDFATNVRGALQLFQQAPASLNVNYSVRSSRVETPTETETINQLNTSTATADGTLRLRVDNDRSLSLIANAGQNTTLTGKRTDRGARAQGRWVQGVWSLDTEISDLVGETDSPRRNNAFGYREKQDNRTASAELSRPLGEKLKLKLTTNINLTQFRSRATADSANPPTPRDNYRQSYRVEGLYNGSERLSSGLGLEVSLARIINLPAVSTSNNNDTRSYRADWRWSYRLMRGLTASQVNSVQADYLFYPFASERDGLSLDFNTTTNLNAILTPRLSIDLSHNARQQPEGDLRRLANGDAGLLLSEENLNYTLRTRVTYTPSPAFSLTLTPDYQATDRSGTTNGVESPTRRSRRLTFSGGALLNLSLGRRGILQGTVNRNFTSDRTTTFRNGEPQSSPLSEQDFWNGSLQLSWTL